MVPVGRRKRYATLFRTKLLLVLIADCLAAVGTTAKAHEIQAVVPTAAKLYNFDRNDAQAPRAFSM